MRKPETVAFWIGRLPHWEVEEGRYFVTIHLAGAIPRPAQQRILEIASSLRRLGNSHPDERLRIQRQIFSEMERWLDRTPIVSELQTPGTASIVVEAIRHREEIGAWRMFEYVVMPSHIHLFFDLPGGGLKSTLQSFKRWTTRSVSKSVGLERDRLWQKEWFDHWSRSDEEDERTITYIRQNPVKAGLVTDYQDWPYGGWSL